MLNVPTVGSFELLYDLIASLIRQLPTMAQMLSSAPVYVAQALALAFLFFGIDFLMAIIENIIRFIKWLNGKL